LEDSGSPKTDKLFKSVMIEYSTMVHERGCSRHTDVFIEKHQQLPFHQNAARLVPL